MRRGDRLEHDEQHREHGLDVPDDALVDDAIEAWRSDVGFETLVEEVAVGFSDRVLAAETSPSLRLAAEPIDDDTVDDHARFTRPWGRMAAGFVLGGALAGGLVYAVVPEGDRDRFDQLAEITDPADVGSSYRGDDEADPLGRPQFRADGIPGAPLPVDLGESIASIVSDYGADWGPAFKFHGTIAVARDGDVLYAQGFGTADRAGNRTNTVDTRFRLGLLTEQFTAAAVLQLRDRGQLGLDDTVTQFFPNYPRGEEITVGQLLQHTSGIPNYTALPYFHTWKDEPHSTEQLLARFSALPLEFEPGTDFSPSNANYYLLGAIVEQVSKVSYGEYVQANLFAPAGMTASTFGDAYETGEQAEGRVWNDEELLDPPDPIDMSVFGGAGGLVSTPGDLVRWNVALSNGTLLSSDSVAEMTKAGDHGYGYGLAVDHGYGQTVLSFPAAIDGFNGSMLHFTEDDTTVVVLCNTEVVPASRVAQDVAMLVYGDTPQRRREAHEVKIAPSTYPRYVGTYRLTEDTWSRYAELTDPERFAMLQTVHVRAYGDRLYFDVPGHGLTWMHPMGRGRFFFKDHSGNRVTFDLDDSKSARGMMLRSKNAAFAFRRE